MMGKQIFAKSTVFALALTGLVALTGCGTTSGPPGNQKVYDCNQLNYETVVVGGASQADLEEANLQQGLGFLFGLTGNRGLTRNPAALGRIGNELNESGKEMRRNNANNPQRTETRRKDWGYVTDPDQLFPTFSTACLGFKRFGNGMTTDDLRYPSGAYNLSKLESIGLNEIIFGTSVRAGWSGSRVRLLIYRSNELQAQIYTSEEVVVSQAPPGQSSLAFVRVPISDLRAVGAIGPCRIEWKIKAPKDTSQGGVLHDRYITTFCP